VVWGTPEHRASLDTVKRLPIDLPDGGQITLDEVADVRLTPSPNVIRHEDVSRSIDIGVDVGGRDITAVADDIKNRLQGMTLPMEYHAEVLDGYADKQAHRRTFVSVVVAVAVGIFLLLQSAFGSWRLASVLFVALPAALTGGVLAALIDGEAISIGTLIGFLAVFAIAVRAAIVFVRRCHDHEDRGEPFGPDLVRRIATERIAPVLTGAVATALVFVPMMTFFGGRAGHEIVHPMAVVIIGGLVTATALNLLAVPALYLHFGRRPEGHREQLEIVHDLEAAEAEAADAADAATPVPSTIDV
jgi:Cu/Ag efflux pump CusA